MSANAHDHHDPTSLAYAQSLLELAEERDQVQSVADEVGGLQQVLADNPTFARFLADPGIDREERAAVLERTFNGKASPLVFNFLKLLEARGRIGRLPSVLAAFESLLDAKLGKVEVNVTVAEELGDAELAEVGRKVSQKLGKDAIVHQFVDPDILGGMIVRVQDQVIDASLRSKLASMERRLKHS